MAPILTLMGMFQKWATPHLSSLPRGTEDTSHALRPGKPRELKRGSSLLCDCGKVVSPMCPRGWGSHPRCPQWGLLRMRDCLHPQLCWDLLGLQGMDPEECRGGAAGLWEDGAQAPALVPAADPPPPLCGHSTQLVGVG